MKIIHWFILIICASLLCILWTIWIIVWVDVIPGNPPRSENYIYAESLINDLTSNNKRMGLAAPPTLKWKTGESGAFVLGINNVNETNHLEAKVNIYLSSVGRDLVIEDVKKEAENWITPITIQYIEPNDVKISKIVINISKDAMKGFYKFRIVICGKPGESIPESCGTIEEEIDAYGTEEFTIEII